MSRIYISLLITLIVALFSTGWLLDQLFNAADSNTSFEQNPRSDYYDYRRFSQGLAKQLLAINFEDQQDFIDQYNQYYPDKISLTALKQLALPQPLLTQLQHNALIINSKDGATLIQKINDTWLLQMDLPSLPKAKTSDIFYSLSLYIGLCLIALLWLTPLIIRLKILDKTAQDFGLGQLNKRVKVSRHSYIGNIEHNFNQMAQRIEDLIEDNRLISGALSHDLRHPVACLKFGIDAIKEVNNPIQYEKYVNRLDSDIQRIDTMVMAFLEYAKLQQPDSTFKLATSDITEIINNTINACQGLSLNTQITLNSQIRIQTCMLDQNWLERAIGNLLNNAIEHDAQTINIILTQENNFIDIKIEDNGTGIALDKRESIFKPFVRLTSGRALTHSNYGLGLAIVHKVISWHQGNVSVIDAPNLKGACFWIRLPILDLKE